MSSNKDVIASDDNCEALREEFRQCILKSDCVVKNKKTVKYCMNHGNECLNFRKTMFKCQRDTVSFLSGLRSDIPPSLSKQMYFGKRMGNIR